MNHNVFDEVELVPLRETDEWQQLFKELQHWQNLHTCCDHMTITGFMKNIQQLRDHVAHVRDMAQSNPN